MTDRETVVCPVCGAAVGVPCNFGDQPPWTVVEDGAERRVVHAGRYAATLPAGEAAAFWQTAVDKYLAERLATAPRADPPDDLDDDPRPCLDYTMTGPDGTLPSGMVEAAARALHEHDRLDSLNEPSWDGLTEGDRDSYRRAAVAVLTAALAVRGICGDRAPTLVGPPSGRVCELLAGHAEWHQCANDDGGQPMSWTAQP